MPTPIEKVKQMREKAQKRIDQKVDSAEKKVFVGLATCEIAAGSKGVMEVFKDELKNVKGVYLSQKGCVGRCNLEPTVEVVENGKIPVKYGKVTPEMAKEIVKRHIINNEVIKEWSVG